MLRGIDVSYAQDAIDWAIVKQTNAVDFAYCRATFDVGEDKTFKFNWQQCAANGIPRGAYDFITLNDDPVKQADAFFKIVGPLQPNDLPPMLDVEAVKPANMSGATYAKIIRKFLEHAETLFGRKLVVYTGGPVFNDSTNHADEADLEYIASHPLWLSAYVVHPDGWVPTAWSKRGKTWTIWQKSGGVSANGGPGLKLAGIPHNVVDYNETQGTAADIVTWIAESLIVAPAVIIPAPDAPAPISVPVAVIDPVIITAEPELAPVQPAPLSPSGPIVYSGLFGVIMQVIRFLISLISKRTQS